MTGHTIVRDLLSTVFAVKFPVRIHGNFKQAITLSSCSFCMRILRCFSERAPKLHTTQWIIATEDLFCWQWCFESQMWYYFLTEKKFVWVRNYMFWICDVSATMVKHLVIGVALQPRYSVCPCDAFQTILSHVPWPKEMVTHEHVSF